MANSLLVKEKKKYINGILDFLGIEKDKVKSLTCVDEKVKYIFDIYKDRIFFDTTKNFLNRKLFYKPQEVLGILKQGYGLNCQEQTFLLKDILDFFGIGSRITHGDVYDFDSGIRKDMFISILVVDRDGYFIHIDSLHKLMVNVKKGGITGYEGFERIEIRDLYSDYYIVKKFDGEVNYYMEVVYKYAEEEFRVKRLKETYKGLRITPFGIIPPFYWGVNPEKKVFYNILKDSIRIVTGRKTNDFDLLEWDLKEESSWLSLMQKENIKKCVSEIIYNIDEYMAVAKIAAPGIDSKITEEQKALLMKL